MRHQEAVLKAAVEALQGALGRCRAEIVPQVLGRQGTIQEGLIRYRVKRRGLLSLAAIDRVTTRN